MLCDATCRIHNTCNPLVSPTPFYSNWQSAIKQITTTFDHPIVSPPALTHTLSHRFLSHTQPTCPHPPHPLPPPPTRVPPRYWLRFMLLGVFELPLYALQRGRRAEAVRAAASMALDATLTLLLWHRCWVATLYTLVLPYVISSLALMFGNW